MNKLINYMTKQERFYEEQLTMDHTKAQLQREIQADNQRVNVDSAKKRACIQYMDYEGFRQMVLGANLFPVKKGAASSIFAAAPGKTKVNHTAAYQDIVDRLGGTSIGYDEEVVRNTLNLAEDESIHAPKNAEEFEKFVGKKCKDSMQRYTYMRLVNIDHLRSIFSRELDPELLLLLVRTFREQVADNENFNTTEEQLFVA